MGNFAVIDTETNWNDKVMSIGVVIADSDTFQPNDARYYVLAPEYEIGGMYENTLFADSRLRPVICSRKDALSALIDWFAACGVRSVFAYNACFDRNHLPELRQYDWYDIMRLAAYRQFNHKIPATADLCSTGRLKRGFGVEPMLRLLAGESAYAETHNALCDAMDELKIMQLLGYDLAQYIPLP